MRLTLALPLAVLAGAVHGEDLIKDAAKITNTKSYISAVSVSWASVFYRVNMNINDAKYLGKAGDYEKAVKLYGTTALPASFVPNWAEGYLSRAHALAGRQSQTQLPTLTPTPTPTRSYTESPTMTPSPTSTPETSAKAVTSNTEPNGALNLRPGAAVPWAIAAAIAAVWGASGSF